MLKLSQSGTTIAVENDHFKAEIHTEGYVSGVAGSTFVDKKTATNDHSFGLDIVDFLLEPGADDGAEGDDTYRLDPMVHGNIPKRYVELPQICTQAERVGAEVFRGEGWVAVRQWYRYQRATRGRKPGSLWEQVLVFPEHTRYFFSMDRITSANAVDELTLRIDLPGHLKHQEGDSFSQIYLSYHGLIAADEFLQDFPPDGRFLYQRGIHPAPARMIRARQHRVDGKPGPWLAGMTLDPGIVSEAWCHQRGYVCFILEMGGVAVQPGDHFSAAHLSGSFDSVAEMEALYDRHAGAREIELQGASWRLV
jgi:hypothetical protein